MPSADAFTGSDELPPFRVAEHRLLGGAPPVLQDPTDHWTPGRTIVPRFLLFHYTVIDFDATRRAFKNRAVAASAHLVVARDGRVAQMVAFDRRAWHAGESRWGDLTDLNSHAIGIEMENHGYLERRGGGQLQSVNGDKVKDEDAVEARHRHPRWPARWWQAYTPAQIEVAQALARALANAYPIEDVLGHDDVAPERKADPGPAFPLDLVQAAAFGREDPAGPAGGRAIRIVSVPWLNMRRGPGAGFALEGPPLAAGTRVQTLSASGAWSLVRPLGALTRVAWVHGSYLRPPP